MVESWFCLFACLAVNNTCWSLLNKGISAHEMHYSPVWFFQTSDICECKILCELCQLCVPVLLFYVISLWFIGDEQRSQKEKWEQSCACFINQVRAGCFFVFLFFCFFVKETFWLNIKNISYISSFNPFNSQIKFVILLTVNHTILIMLVQRI